MAPGYLFCPQPTSSIFCGDADGDSDEAVAFDAEAIMDG
jgi:hypothetical protein